MQLRKILLILLFILSFFITIMTAEAQQLQVQDASGKGHYLPTTPSIPSLHQPESYTGNVTRLKPEGKFTADNQSNYPFEIYLPNEINPENYQIHSNLKANTNACKSCHSIHTSVGPALLQWYDTYHTCMACHDGTVSTTYNVRLGRIGDTGMPTFAGAFGTGGENSISSHSVQGAVNHSAAPGGASEEYAIANPNPDNKGNNASWAIEFGCESCHSPHGEGANARILNPNPNGTAWAIYNSGQSQNVELRWDAEQNVFYTDYNADGIRDFWLFGYPYDTKTVIYGVDSSGNIIEDLILYYLLNNKNGDYTQITFTSEPDVQPAGYRANFIPAVKIKMNISNYLKVNEKIEYLSGLNAFCGTCHPDYNTEKVKKEQAKNEPNGSGNVLSGNYSEAYRHQVGMKANLSNSNDLDKLKLLGLKFEQNETVTCETCHFAHGTNSDFWKKTIGTGNTLLPTDLQFENNQIFEQTGSSALKRLPNMAACDGCHKHKEGQEGYAPIVAPVPGIQNDTQAKSEYGDNQDYKCQSCHQQQYQSYMANKHASTGMVFCSNCHGPTVNHLSNPSAINITTPTSKNVSEFLRHPNWANYDSGDPGWNTLCWFCHDSWYRTEVTEYKQSAHYESGLLDCFTCHPVHQSTQESGTRNCSICHYDKYTDSLALQFGHIFQPVQTINQPPRTTSYSHLPLDNDCTQCHIMRSNKIKNN